MCVQRAPDWDMPRLTIYVPDELDLALRTFPGEMNVSQVCAAALRAELSARGSIQSLEGLATAISATPSVIEDELRARFGLRSALVGHEGDAKASDTIGFWASEFLDSAFYEGLKVAMGGGTQMWEIARRLQPRNLGIAVQALGFGHVDPELPHVHPNALVTLLAMLYGSRTRPGLVGAATFARDWKYPANYPPGEANVRRIIIGSCSTFDADSPYARLLGKEMTDFLVEEHVMGDFLGVFIAGDGRILEPWAPSMTVSHVTSTDLQRFAKRDDAMVLLAAGGPHKVKFIRTVLEMGFCNAFITDHLTAEALSA
jgi:DNA-binding transcriptional regulator LsrR (DeoR family)